MNRVIQIESRIADLRKEQRHVEALELEFKLRSSTVRDLKGLMTFVDRAKAIEAHCKDCKFGCVQRAPGDWFINCTEGAALLLQGRN